MNITVELELDVWGLGFEIDFIKPLSIYVKLGCITVWVWL